MDIKKISRIKKPWMKLRISREVGKGDRRSKIDKEEEITSRKRTKKHRGNEGRRTISILTHPISQQPINTGFIRNLFLSAVSCRQFHYLPETPVAFVTKFIYSRNAGSESVSKRNSTICISHRHVTFSYTCKLQLPLSH